MYQEFSRSSSDFDWLCAAQHHGIPTRILDWSETLIVAMFFSSLPLTKDNTSPTIWMLNPFDLAHLVTGREILPTSEDENVLAYCEYPFFHSHSKNTKNLPIPVIPNHLFPRMRAQDSCFTVHGKDVESLESQLEILDGDPILIKFVCDPKSSSYFRLQVDLLCRNRAMIFPDIEGFSQWLGPDAKMT